MFSLPERDVAYWSFFHTVLHHIMTSVTASNTVNIQYFSVLEQCNSSRLRSSSLHTSYSRFKAINYNVPEAFGGYRHVWRRLQMIHDGLISRMSCENSSEFAWQLFCSWFKKAGIGAALLAAAPPRFRAPPRKSLWPGDSFCFIQRKIENPAERRRAITAKICMSHRIWNLSWSSGEHLYKLNGTT